MTDWNKLKVVDLKAELANRGLAQTGLKAALVARLVEADGQDGSESEATVQDDSKNDASSAASPDTVASSALPHSGLSNEAVLQDEKTGTPFESKHDEKKEATSLNDALVNEAELPAELKAEDVPQVNAISPDAQDSKAELPVPDSTPRDLQQDDISAQSTGPAIESQGAVEDTLKRKRRSQSPPPVSEDVARKRFKTEETNEPQDEVITTDADAEWVERHNGVDEEAVNAEAKEVQSFGNVLPEPTIIDTSKEEVVVEDLSVSLPREPSPNLPDSPSRARDSRFTGLFTKSNANRGSPEPTDAVIERDVEPAIHPATSALYIKNLMRPLHASMLQSHLAMLATAPGNNTDPEVILNFYLDPIKTHAFVIFKSTSAAARVRNAFHDRTWPDEKNRKQLWVDFVPSEKAEDWITEEMATSNGPRSQKKWEVDYHVDEDRKVTATLQEANTLRPSQPMRQPIGPSTSQSTAPRGFDPPSGPRGFIHPPPRPANVSRLNELYESTTTKPVLYFQPVAKDLANKRLDKIDSSLSKDVAAGRRVMGDIHRYTFEDGDQLVDRGPEIFSGIRPPARGGYRGGRGGGAPSYRDSYHGKDSRRDGGYDDRRADTYRTSDRRDARSDRRY